MQHVDSTSASRPRFRPWKGEDFDDGLGGIRVLIVGEAHHGPDDQNQDAEFTTRCLNHVLAGRWKLRFFANIPPLFDAIPTSPRKRSEFWTRVAFYNFIQEMIPKPGVAPCEAAWRDARRPFESVLADLRPDCVLFACKRLFVRVAPNFSPALPLQSNGHTRPAIQLQWDGGTALGSFVLHPTYRGYRTQRHWVAELWSRASVAR